MIADEDITPSEEDTVTAEGEVTEGMTLDEFEAVEGGIIEVDRGTTEEALIVRFDAYEGPLDVLLTLARTQKVDLKQISVMALADQYLAFVAEARKVRLELAADYLVMAAWLAFLKSRLILPEEESEDGEPTGEELAARLAFRLQRLEAMRKSAARLFARDRLGRDFFFRGMPEGIRTIRNTSYVCSLYDLLKAYGDERSRVALADYKVERPPVFSMEMALQRLKTIVGTVPEWTTLVTFLPDGWAGTPEERRSAIAGTFAASLEMVREGKLELRQTETYGQIFLRSSERDDGAAAAIDTEQPVTDDDEDQDD